MNPLSLSRSDDKTLLDFRNQEEYYRILKSKSGEAKLYAIRKLREGLLASKRIDEFSICVYEDSVEECIAQENFQELIKSLARLLDIYCEYPRITLRKREMQNYFLLYQYCYNDQPNICVITKQIEKYDINPDEPAVRFIRSINICNYHAAESQWREMSHNDKSIALMCFGRFRPLVLEALKKSFFTLPAIELQKALLIDPLNEKDVLALNQLLPFGISNGMCELKRRHVK